MLHQGPQVQIFAWRVRIIQVTCAAAAAAARFVDMPAWMASHDAVILIKCPVAYLTFLFCHYIIVNISAVRTSMKQNKNAMQSQSLSVS